MYMYVLTIRWCVTHEKCPFNASWHGMKHAFYQPLKSLIHILIHITAHALKLFFLKTYVKRIFWSTYLLPSSQATVFESVFYSLHSLHRYGKSRRRTQIPWLATMMIYNTFVLRMLLEVYVKRALMNKVKHLVILYSYVYHTLYVRLTCVFNARFTHVAQVSCEVHFLSSPKWLWHFNKTSLFSCR